MKRAFVFHEGELAPGYRFQFEVAIFNTPVFRTLQSANGWSSFYVLLPETRSVHAHIHFHVCEGVALTPLRAPFGSVEVSDALPADILFEFLAFAESRLRQRGVSKIVVKNPPDAYHPGTAALLHTFLLAQAYTTTTVEIGSVIGVSAEPFSAGLHPRKRRKLQQSRTQDFRFVQLPEDATEEVYGFILDCRDRKQYRLSITLEELQTTISQFPGRYKLFGVYVDATLVAASIAIRVNEKVLYHFISDHLRKTAPFYPALVLMEGIYAYCFEEKVQMLDLGTSALQGKPNFKLLNFKRELGGRGTSKFTFTKNCT